jgi:hypothetical protein
MRKVFMIGMCVCLISGLLLAKEKAKTVTVTGCIREGTECFVLETTAGVKKYSVPKRSDLQVGHSYRITGTVSDTGVCTQGLKILSPTKITELKLRCP